MTAEPARKEAPEKLEDCSSGRQRRDKRAVTMEIECNMTQRETNGPGAGLGGKKSGREPKGWTS